jgi:hypothetical protein
MATGTPAPGKIWEPQNSPGNRYYIIDMRPSLGDTAYFDMVALFMDGPQAIVNGHYVRVSGLGVDFLDDATDAEIAKATRLWLTQ